MWSHIRVYADSPGRDLANWDEYMGPFDTLLERRGAPNRGVDPKYRKTRMDVLRLEMLHADGRSHQFRNLGEDSFHTYAVFLENVVGLIMLFKACVLADVQPDLQMLRAEANELRRQYEDGELSGAAAEDAETNLYRRYERARRQFPEEYDQHPAAQESDEIEYTDMFCLVRLTPAQLASLPVEM
jgi:hypothetical protein